MSILRIQDLLFSHSYSLHEAILSASQNAISGAGAFAFVTKSALRLTLEDVGFAGVLPHFHFIAGIDQITNVNTLLYLSELSQRNTGLRVNAFEHDSRNSLFHPKFCWFRYNTGGALIIGSGNFTISGLRTNREAFSVVNLNNREMNEVEAHWESWLNESDRYLKNVNDDSVLERARLNRRIIIPRTQIVTPEAVVNEATPETPPQELLNDDEENESWFFTQQNQVLIAEIPKSGTRWKQANFDVTTFQQFFGAIPGDNSQRILLRAVNQAGELQEIESRQSVSVQSQNYRFELDAASNIQYPQVGRPIGVFVKISPRVFLYILSLPGLGFHNNLVGALNRLATARTGQVKRVTTTVQDVLAEIGLTPLSHFLI